MSGPTSSVENERPILQPPPRRSRLTESHGEGVDRPIQKKLVTPRRVALAVLSIGLAGLVGYALWTSMRGGKRLNIDPEKLTVSSVTRAPFQEYIAVTGTAVPLRTVYLDAVEGGRVEEVFVREGSLVEAGDPLLRLSNSDLRLRLMANEAHLAEQTAMLEQMRFQVDQNRLDLRQQLAQMDYAVHRLERQHERNVQLHDKDLIADSEYEEVADELAYQRRRRDLTLASFRQDSLLQETRLKGMAEAVHRMRANFGMLEETLGQLTVRAPIGGQLTALDAEVGQIHGSGSRFGQIDVLDGYKVRARIDEFYISRVQRNQTATTQPAGGQAYTLAITRVYPEVEEGYFEVDLAFQGAPPAEIRRGQTIRLRLQLGNPEHALLLARGGFYQSTGGRWAFVLSDDGREAVRRPIQIGRQNPEQFEVLSGLEPGERVITSSYDALGDADRLVLD